MDDVIDPKKFKLGVLIVDEEHKVLIDYLNRLSRMWGEVYPDLEREVILGLMYYVKVHFTVEEEFIKIYKYPHTEDHLKSHRDFAEKIQSFKKDLESGGRDIRGAIIDYLKDWLVDHISGTDRDLCKYLNSKGVH